jgi:hypothetical protein
MQENRIFTASILKATTVQGMGRYILRSKKSMAFSPRPKIGGKLPFAGPLRGCPTSSLLSPWAGMMKYLNDCGELCCAVDGISTINPFFHQ